MREVSLKAGEIFIEKNESTHKILIIENVGKGNCMIKSSKSEKDFRGYKLMQYSDKDFSVGIGEKLEITCGADTTIRITGTDY